MSTALTTLTNNLAKRFSLDENSGLIDTLKATAFKGQVSDAQMTALLIVAQQYGLNPWTKEIYAFPDKNNGIVPVVGVDGWSRIINDNPLFDGMDFDQDSESCTCRMFRKDRAHPVSVTEYMSECKRSTGPWQSHPKRMLRHKAMIQCARLAFGYGGIYDQDEAERISEIEINPIRRQSGAQVAESARNTSAVNLESDERKELVTKLENIAASFGIDAYAESWRGLTKEQRAMVGAEEHARLKSLSSQPQDDPSTIDHETGEVVNV